MRKEIILAIVLGVALGSIIIFGINLANQSSSKAPKPAGQTNQPSVAPLNDQDTVTLQLLSPKKNSVSFEDSLVVTGITKENAWVSLIWEQGQAIVKADTKGKFEKEIDLVGGENSLKITATNGREYQETLVTTIVYTTAEIPEDQPTSTPTSSNSKEASDSANQVDENLKKRIQEIVKDKDQENKLDNSLKGYVGTIAKINDTAIVITTVEGKTLQIITSDTTDIVRSGQDIKASSLSINERVIIIGYLNTQDILSAKRIVAIKDGKEDNRQTIVGPVTETNLKANSFTLQTTTQKLVIDLPKKSSFDLEELQENQTLLAIVEIDEKEEENIFLEGEII
jgi:hypothetical protein